MKKLLVLALLLIAAAARAAAPDAAPVETAAMAKAFDDFKLHGTMLVYDEQADRFLVHDAKRAGEGFIPASTFKIFNALTALETGAVADEYDVIRWDGQPRSMPMWNRDHSLASGMRYSVVWFYQAIARRIGQEKMQRWIDSADYGNHDLGGGIDQFWLDGKLRISAEQQVTFLRRLADGTLPFSRKSQEAVRRITLLENGPDYTLHGKTGYADKAHDGVDLGWLVGWAERGGRRWFFALNIDMPGEMDDANKRHLLVRRVLIDQGALPASAAKPIP